MQENFTSNFVNISEVKCTNPKLRKQKQKPNKLIKSYKIGSDATNDVLADEPHNDKAEKIETVKTKSVPPPPPTSQKAESSGSNLLPYCTALLAAMLIL